MVALYIVLMVCIGLALFGSYHGMVNGAAWGCWLFGISVWILFAILIGVAMFK